MGRLISKVSLISCFSLAIVGCSNTEVNLTPWWKGPQLAGWYPLMAGAHEIVIFGEQVFIDAKSVLRNCAGAPLKNREELMFLLESEQIALFDPINKIVRNTYPLREFGNIFPNAAPIQSTNRIYADLNRSMTIDAEQNQCNKDVNHAAKAFKWK